NPPVGRTVVVLGVGPLGLCHLVKARLTGAGRIVATDKFESRLALAGDLGADNVFNVSETTKEDRTASVLAMTGGRGADIVVDCSGVPATFTESLRLVRNGGVIIEAGTFVDMGPVGINPNSDICTPSVSIVGVGGETAVSYAPAMALMTANLSRYPLEKIVTHEFSLDRAEDAVIAAQADGAMQVVINPTLSQGEAQ
ncbi:MAG TPA: zinc-binding dehydrogenase, partial [Acidimicrobiales bacterium]|nr:zinc-binding dehydrogenase [Acidimicrobiales bacterium]